MTTKTKPKASTKPKPTSSPQANRSAKSSKGASAAEATKPAAKLASPPPESIAQRQRRIRGEKAAADLAEALALGKLLDSTPGLRELIGGRPLLKRSEHVAWTHSEWNELEEVCRKFRAFFPKLTIVQCELVARTQMKTNLQQLEGLSKAWHVWTDRYRRTRGFPRPVFPPGLVIPKR